MDDSLKRNINNFLTLAKLSIQNGNYSFEPRKKNMDFITNKLHITIDQTKQEFLNLTYRDYDDGPKKDYRGDGTDIWEFGKNINGYDTYIKIKVDQRGCVCLSFHDPEKPFKLPFQK